MESKTITLNNKVFVFLAALLGEAVVLGVDDPFLGWLAEQVEEEWKRLSPVMLENGLIYIGDDGSYKVSLDIYDYIRLCCTPDIWVSVNGDKQGEGKYTFVLNIGMENKNIVKVSRMQEDGLVELVVSNYKDNENSEIAKLLDIRSDLYSSGVKFEVPEVIFKTIKNSDLKKAEKYTCQIPKHSLDQFRETLINPMSKLLINIGSMKSSATAMQSFVLLNGRSSMWRVEYFDEKNEKTVKICESDKKDVICRIGDILEQLL